MLVSTQISIGWVKVKLVNVFQLLVFVRSALL